MRAFGQTVGEPLEARPDGLNHDLQALTSLEALRAEPDACHNSTNEHRKVGATHTKASSCEDWEVNAEHGTNVAIQHCRNAYQKVSNEYSED